jgi:hypothetical protein
VNRQEFLDLPWSDNVREKLIAHMETGEAEAYSATLEDGRWKAQVWANNPGEWDTENVYVVAEPESEIEVATGSPFYRTDQALRLMQDKGWTAYRAAKFVGISQAAISRAVSRRRGKSICPACNQVLRKP